MPTQLLPTPQGKRQFQRDLNRTISNIGVYFLQSAQMRQRERDNVRVNKIRQSQVAIQQQNQQLAQQRFGQQQQQAAATERHRREMERQGLIPKTTDAFVAGELHRASQGQVSPTQGVTPTVTPDRQLQPVGFGAQPATQPSLRIPATTQPLQPSQATGTPGIDQGRIDQALALRARLKETPSELRARTALDARNAFLNSVNPDVALTADQRREAVRNKVKTFRDKAGKFHIEEQAPKPTATEELYANIRKYYPPAVAAQMIQAHLEGKAGSEQLDRGIKQARLTQLQDEAKQRKATRLVQGVPLNLTDAQYGRILSEAHKNTITTRKEIIPDLRQYDNSRNTALSAQDAFKSLTAQLNSRPDLKANAAWMEAYRKQAAVVDGVWASYFSEVNSLAVQMADNIWLDSNLQAQLKGKTDKQAEQIIQRKVSRTPYTQVKSDLNLKREIQKILENLYNAREAVRTGQ